MEEEKKAKEAPKEESLSEGAKEAKYYAEQQALLERVNKPIPDSDSDSNSKSDDEDEPPVPLPVKKQKLEEKELKKKGVVKKR